MGKKSSPPPDYKPVAEASVEAAKITSALGREQLAFARQQYAETAPLARQVAKSQIAAQSQQMQQAQDYYDYQINTFRPLEQGLVKQANEFNTDSYREEQAREAAAASGGVLSESTPLVQTGRHGMAMVARNGRPVFITLGADGVLACTADEFSHEPAVPVSGPIDIVGAGDSASAGIVCGLSAGASIVEAARLGNLCAGVTIRKLGTTGTASPEEVVRLSEEHPVR